MESTAIEPLVLPTSPPLHPIDAQGRYNPAPGTEYPFSISDIGRAAARLLGDDWDADSTGWGVGAYIEHADELGGFKIHVDEEGDLYVRRNYLEPEYLTDLRPDDGLATVASHVATVMRRYL
ncbi:hypothetical protein ACFV98_02570 [Streptomyces violascens]|uniref:hypothetical protein n=1 Tax=Streptomyces violascens TaxID=67381 RepID=UPI003666AC9F